MKEHDGGLTLANLPSELHHVIFSYLDYVRDICGHPLLYVPIVKMPQTLEEFDQLLLSDDFDDFEKPPTLGLFLTCKGILKSIKTFLPKCLSITIFDESKHKGRYHLDKIYEGKLEGLRYAEIVNYMPYERESWLEVLCKFVWKLKKICYGKQPLRQVEFLSLNALMGKNYHRSSFYSNLGLREVTHRLMPCVKHLLFNFNVSCCGELPDTFFYCMAINNYNKPCLNKFENYLTSYRIISKEFEHVPITELSTILPKPFQHVENLLCYYIMHNQSDNANYLIENFTLDIEYFIYVWNIPSYDIENVKIEESLKQIMEILQKIFLKYPTFRIFRIPIYSIRCLNIILKYPFVNINVEHNLTVEFLADTIGKEEIISFCKEYNVNLSHFGKYQQSAASFVTNCFEISKVELDPNSRDVFGITPWMIQTSFPKNADFSISDKYGNNWLHYYRIRHSFYNEQPIVRLVLTKTEIDHLGEEPNIFGTTPKEIAVYEGNGKVIVENFYCI